MEKNLFGAFWMLNADFFDSQLIFSMVCRLLLWQFSNWTVVFISLCHPEKFNDDIFSTYHECIWKQSFMNRVGMWRSRDLLEKSLLHFLQCEFITQRVHAPRTFFIKKRILSMKISHCQRSQNIFHFHKQHYVLELE